MKKMLATVLMMSSMGALAQTAEPGTAAIPELEAPIPLDQSAPADPVNSTSAPMAPAAPAQPYRPQPDNESRAAAPAASGRAVTEINQNVPRGCQVQIQEQWKVTPVPNMAECGRLLIKSVGKSGAKSGQAYWAGNYLFYTNQQLYHSTNGQDWQTIPSTP